jgi:hypothetical protein
LQHACPAESLAVAVAFDVGEDLEALVHVGRIEIGPEKPETPHAVLVNKTVHRVDDGVNTRRGGARFHVRFWDP